MKKLTVAEIRAELAHCHPDALEALLVAHASDVRPGVVAACQAARARKERSAAERERLRTLEAAEVELRARGMTLIAGIDEVGRGALAGPVTACACVLPAGSVLLGLNDSKKLSAAARQRLDTAIREVAYAVAVAHVPPSVIDEVGIGNATVRAMRQALESLNVLPEHVLVDGLPVELGCAATAVVHGDARVRVIAAASIVAKVARDALMTSLEARYPGYEFARNKGYGSAAHLEALHRLGPSPVHRQSFAPCCQETLFKP